MRVAITGATGLLGRYLVRHLAGGGHHLRCWYRPGSDRSGFESQAEAIEWLPGSLGDESSVSELVQGVDSIVHAAVEWEGRRTRVRGSHGAPGVFFGVNLTGSLQLFQTAFEARVPRFVFLSTCAVHEVIMDNRPLDETHPLWPTSHYGAHKLRWRHSSTAMALDRAGPFVPYGRPASTAWLIRPRAAAGMTS